VAAYETESRLAPDEVLRRADRFFGPAGLGLTPRDMTDFSAEWQGGGGAVWVTVHKDQDRTRVEVATREYDNQARIFIGEIAG
jgi:hypothetical protein